MPSSSISPYKSCQFFGNCNISQNGKSYICHQALSLSGIYFDQDHCLRLARLRHMASSSGKREEVQEVQKSTGTKTTSSSVPEVSSPESMPSTTEIMDFNPVTKKYFRLLFIYSYLSCILHCYCFQINEAMFCHISTLYDLTPKLLTVQFK